MSEGRKGDLPPARGSSFSAGPALGGHAPAAMGPASSSSSSSSSPPASASVPVSPSAPTPPSRPFGSSSRPPSTVSSERGVSAPPSVAAARTPSVYGSAPGIWAVVKTGWMKKRGRVFKTWRRRWFVLRQGGPDHPPTLSYSKTKSGPQKGVLVLGQGSLAAVSTLVPNCFVVAEAGSRGTTRELYVQTDTNKRCETWIVAINKLIDRTFVTGDGGSSDEEEAAPLELQRALSSRGVITESGYADLPALTPIREAALRSEDRGKRHSFDGSRVSRRLNSPSEPRRVSSFHPSDVPGRLATAPSSPLRWNRAGEGPSAGVEEPREPRGGGLDIHGTGEGGEGGKGGEGSGGGDGLSVGIDGSTTNGGDGSGSVEGGDGAGNSDR